MVLVVWYVFSFPSSSSPFSSSYQICYYPMPFLLLVFVSSSLILLLLLPALLLLLLKMLSLLVVDDGLLLLPLLLLVDGGRIQGAARFVGPPCIVRGPSLPPSLLPVSVGTTTRQGWGCLSNQPPSKTPLIEWLALASVSSSKALLCQWWFDVGSRALQTQPLARL